MSFICTIPVQVFSSIQNQVGKYSVNASFFDGLQKHLHDQQGI